MKNSLFNSVRKAIKHWYIPLIIGILFIALGILVMTRPESSFLAIAILFSLSFLLGGLAESIFYISNRDRIDNWGWPLAFGVTTMIIGILMLTNPALSMTTLALFIGFILLFRSISYISYSLDLKNYGIKNWGWMLGFGIISAIVSIVLILNPVIAGLSVVLLVALNFILVGILNAYLSIQLRNIHKSSKKLSDDLQRRHDELMQDISRELGD
ncbi:HdeD family acid-resistance protein [Flavobacteriaceae bacterium Ap0902]|nr:HdeD family acid-resistance protein [Flavobacteriaceae bacterium Ap0902]